MKRQNAETDKAFRILDICNELLNWILMIILVILFCYGTYGIGDSYMLEENAMPEQYDYDLWNTCGLSGSTVGG